MAHVGERALAHVQFQPPSQKLQIKSADLLENLSLKYEHSQRYVCSAVPNKSCSMEDKGQ